MKLLDADADPRASGPASRSGSRDDAASRARDDVASGPAVRDGIVVGPMKRRHLRAVTAIERGSNSHPWSHSLFAGELRMPTSRHWLIARNGRDVIGFAGLMWTLDEGHVTNFAVHPEHRREHIAARMMIALCRDAIELGVTDLTLEVRMSNAPARSLYGRFGFAPGGVRRGYYNDNGEDALIMWLHGMDGVGFDERLRVVESELPVEFVRETR